MCVAIHLPKHTTLTDEEIGQCWATNSDGAGFMYANGGKLIVVKGLMKLDAFRKAFENHSKIANDTGKGGMCVHFRIKTHGKQDQVNTHPHVVIRGTLGLIHNGVLSDFTWAECSEFSDTALLVKRYLSKFPPNWWRCQALCNFIAGHVKPSKLVTMDNAGNVMLFNPHLGEYEKGTNRWFSNTYWRNRTYVSRSVVSDYKDYRADKYGRSDADNWPHDWRRPNAWIECTECKVYKRPELVTRGVCDVCFHKAVAEFDKEQTEKQDKPNPPQTLPPPADPGGYTQSELNAMG